MPNSSVLILTDETEFARLLTACWQAERQAPAITVLGSDLWKERKEAAHDLVVVGPLRDANIFDVLGAAGIRGSCISLCAKTGPKLYYWSRANRCAAPRLCGSRATPKAKPRTTNNSPRSGAT